MSESEQEDQQQPTEQPEQPNAEQPPWGSDFNAERAWSLVQNLRGDKDKLKADLDQAAADREELERLRSEKLTADEKALKEATAKASEEAKAQAESEWRPKYQTAQLKSAASQVIKDKDQLTAFMAITDPAKFAGDDGDIDEEKVMGHLTALYVGQQTKGTRSWGQHSGTTPNPDKAGQAGLAEAKKRFGDKAQIR